MTKETAFDKHLPKFLLIGFLATIIMMFAEIAPETVSKEETVAVYEFEHGLVIKNDTQSKFEQLKKSNNRIWI